MRRTEMSLRLSEEEKAELVRIAQKRGKSLADTMRELIANAARRAK